MSIREIYEIFLSCGSEICTDTRKLKKGSFFIAIKGANFDGNKYAVQALESGCSKALVSDPDLRNNKDCIFVKDTLETLQKLANHHRNQFDIPILGITGSNGKTSTKELIHSVLKTQYNVLVTEGNLNNHLGVPFTLLRLRKEHEIAVIEMGANQPNDIAELCEIVLPNLGVITNIGKAHIEGFGSFEKLLETKLELYDSVSSNNGLIFINLNEKELVTNAPSCDLISYGASGQITGTVIGADPYLEISWKGSTEHLVKTNLIGAYNLANILTAITIGVYFDISEENINSGISSYSPNNNRSQFVETGKNKLILDCYNANPTSMINALTNIEGINAKRKILILGDMKELGPISEAEHANIYAKASSISNEVYLVGDEFNKLGKEKTFKDVSSIIDHFRNESISDALILIKGSRSIALEKIHDAKVF